MNQHFSFPILVLIICLFPFSGNAQDIIWLKKNYDHVNTFCQGFALVEDDNKAGFVDKFGKVVIPTIYDDAKSFSEGLAKVRLKGKWGFINKRGHEVIPVKYDVAYDFSEGLAAVELNGKCGFIDKTGKEIIKLKYDDARSFSNGLAMVKKDFKKGFINLAGEEIITLKYQSAYDFSEGLAGVKLDGKWGFINNNGKVEIPLKYNRVYSFENNMAKVDLKGKEFYINPSGNEISVDKSAAQSGYTEKLMVVQENDKFGYFDEKGNEIFGTTFDMAWPSTNGILLIKSDEKWGIIQNPLVQEFNKQGIHFSWLSPNPDVQSKVIVDEPDFRFEIKIKGKGFSPKDVLIYNNNSLVSNKAGEVSLKGATYIAEIRLTDGDNNIEIELNGERSSSILVNYSAKKPNLHLIAIGPDYKLSTSLSDLEFTDEDATAIKELFKNQKGKIFENVFTQQLIGSGANAKDIDRAITTLESRNPIGERDVVLLFISSHGGIKSDLGEDKFYIHGNDYDVASWRTTSYKFDNIMYQLKQISCKKLVFVDACFSGGIKSDGKATAINETILALSQEQDGIVVLSSSSDSEASHEDASWGHGAFTKALLDGFKGAADKNSDDKITISEIASYVSKEVPIMVLDKKGKNQNPKMINRNLSLELPIFVY